MGTLSVTHFPLSECHCLLAFVYLKGQRTPLSIDTQ
jgi:hypothetical protein